MFRWDTKTAMEISGAGKANTSLSFRYKANNEELEELFDVIDDEPPSPSIPSPLDSPNLKSETDSPKKAERTPSIIDKYFKSMRTDKEKDKQEDNKPVEAKNSEEMKPSKDVQSSPMKEYLKNLGKRNVSEPTEGPNETWKIFHDFKFKIAQAVEDMKTRSGEETKEKEKSVHRDSSVSDSEENSVIKDSDPSIGDTDNQVSSIESSMQNLSEMSQPVTAKASEREVSVTSDKNNSDSSDDTHKNLCHSEISDLGEVILTDAQMEVESGVEALEDGIDGFSVVNPAADASSPNGAPEPPSTPPPSPLKTAFRLPPSNTNIWKPPKDSPKEPKIYFFNFTMYLVTFLLIANYLLFRDWNLLNGFMLGIWFFCFASNLKQWILDNYFSDKDSTGGSFFTLKKSSAMPITYTIPSVKEHRPVKKFEGWVNHYRFPSYDPYTYHLNKTTTAFMKLEGSNLRISYTKTKVSKRAFWDEKIDKVEFYQHRLYNLTGARVILLPAGLVKRRQWSKKYPICIILSEKEKIQVIEKESAAAERRASEAAAMDRRRDTMFEIEKESTETNTSPEKKRKFVWRRRDKSVSHVDNDSGKESASKEPVGKEGLRHRLVRKMHRDKKTDNVSTYTEPDNQSQADKNMQFEEVTFHDAEMEPTKSATSTKDDATEEELDDTEMSRIKDFLEEAELETGAESTSAEGEWSVHVKQSKNTNSKLFFFARTGRDKHEWFRRLAMSIQEANASLTPEPSVIDERSTSEPSAAENKDGIEMAVYKLHATDKEGVSFTIKPSTKESKENSEKLTNPIPPAPEPTFENLETTFWPYLLKIIQSHEATSKTRNDIGVMCEIEPSPHARTRKKPKHSKTTPSPTCECRMLPSEVTWLNTVAGRIAYDVMNNEAIIARLQTRIQKKLNTLKLPSFMSPLVVTELHLSGACPLIERISAPTWDERGVWLDADLRYDGGAFITVLTQINLMNLKEKNMTLEEQLMSTTDNLIENGSDTGLSSTFFNEPRRKPAVYDSEVEDSAESSNDDETPPPVQPIDSSETIVTADTSMNTGMDVQAASSKKKFLRMVDKIATNKYFQQVTDYKYVKRAMEGLSNTDIKLQLEVQGLEGRMVINLPPPPHDRVWMGFRSNPQLVLKARPAVGARTLRFAHISNWIEQKLSKEFEKLLVLPNMEDLIINIMNPTPIDGD